MLAHMKRRTTGESTEIVFVVPTKNASTLEDTLAGVMNLVGYEVRRDSLASKKRYSVKDVFPDASPAMLLRGLRGKTGMTQEELAERLGIAQTRVSEMESGKRGISKLMAKKLGEIFEISYKAFL